MATLIIGAGASRAISPVFKSSIGLLAEIKHLLGPDQDLRNRIISELEIRESSIITFINNLDAYEKEANRNQLTPSIDSFRYAIKNFPVFEKVRDDYDWISKIAIMFCILQWEKNYKEEVQLGSVNFNDNWVSKISKYLITSEKTKHGTLQIVTFNYDRLLEHLLNLHGYTDNSNDLVFWKRIVHVYGSINIDVIPFGYIPNSLIELKKPIEDFHTIHDFNVPNRRKLPQDWLKLTRQELAHKYISGSGKLFFMGFGFDKFNCQRIGLQPEISSKCIGNIYVEPSEIFGRGMLEASRVRSIFPYMKIAHLDCEKFIAEEIL